MTIRQIKNSVANILLNKSPNLPGLTRREAKRIRALPRYQKGETLLFGKKIIFADAVTFLSSLEEIFHGDVYKFIDDGKPALIIDCGANIGLATLYFKMKHPKATVISFEPDPNIFGIMKANVLSFGFDDVTLRNEAVSSEDSIVNFHLEGGHSGMIVQNAAAENVVPIKAKRLKDLLAEYDEITFLKIDIEGHEKSVMPDIADQLSKVKFLYLEYHSFIDEEQNLGKLLDIIASAGFRYYMKEAYNKPLPFISREIFLKMDFLTNIYCYRP